MAATSLPLVRLCPCWVTLLGRAREESGIEKEEKVKRAVVSQGLGKLVRVDLYRGKNRDAFLLPHGGT